MIVHYFSQVICNTSLDYNERQKQGQHNWLIGQRFGRNGEADRRDGRPSRRNQREARVVVAEEGRESGADDFPQSLILRLSRPVC